MHVIVDCATPNFIYEGNIWVPGKTGRPRHTNGNK